MNNLNKLCLLTSLVCMLSTGQSLAAGASTASNLNGVQLAHDVGVPHFHGPNGEVVFGRSGDGGYYNGGRIRSYSYCSQNVFEPCKRNGGSYRYCNRLHHLCTYGHTRNCIPGRTC